MKYSFMSFSTPELTLKECLAVAKKLGYDGFEPRLDAEHKHGVETSASAGYLADVRKLSEETGIAISCIATSRKMADPGNAAMEIDKAKSEIELAAQVGCHALRVFGGLIPDGVTREKATLTLVESLSKITKFANDNNVHVCLETHDDWCDPLIVSEAAKESGCSVNWDIMHTELTAKCSPEKSFDLLKPYIRHVHVHDGMWVNGNLQLAPVGKGAVNHGTPIRLLRETGYAGYISGEWIKWEPWEIHLPRELKLLKEIEGE